MASSVSAAALRLSQRRAVASAWHLDLISAGRRPCASSQPAATALTIPFHGQQQQRRSASLLSTLSTSAPRHHVVAVSVSETHFMSARAFASASLTPNDIEEMKRQIALMNSRSEEKSATHSDRLTRRLIDEQLAGNSKVKLTSEFLNGTLNTFQVLSDKAAETAKLSMTRPNQAYAEKAGELLRCIERAYKQDNAISPDAKSYGIVIDTYAKSGNPGKAEEILNQMVDLWKAGNEKTRPYTLTYNSVINAWANSGRRDAPERAEALLKHIEDLSHKGYKELRPDSITFNAVINAHAKSGEKGAAQRAEDILIRMEELRKEKGYSDVSPNTITFNTVINAHAKSSDKGAAQRAEKILNHMIQLFEDGREECRPDVFSFNSVIDAWARSQGANAGNRSEMLFEKMEKLGKTKGYEDMRPNAITYNSVMNAHAKGGDKRSALRAETILRHIIKLSEGGREECRPDVEGFTVVIDAWAKSKEKEAPQHAERIIQLMKNLSMKGYKDVEPNVFTYSSLLNAYAICPNPNKAVKAFELVKWMESEAKNGNKRVAPTIQTYGAVLKACAWSNSQGTDTAKVLRIALQTFETMRNSPDIHVDSIIYNSFFQTISRTTKGDQQMKITREVFRLCCDDGLLNDFVLDKLHKKFSKKLFVHLVGSTTPKVKIDDLPREWSRNIRRVRVGSFAIITS